MSTTKDPHPESLYALAARLHDAALEVEVIVAAYTDAKKLQAAMQDMRAALQAIEADAKEARRGTDHMKVKHVIARLITQDPGLEVEIPVQTYTQRYPAGYFAPHRIEISWTDAVRIWTHLPKGYTISKRGKK